MDAFKKSSGGKGIRLCRPDYNLKIAVTFSNRNF